VKAKKQKHGRVVWQKPQQKMESNRREPQIEWVEEKGGGGCKGESTRGIELTPRKNNTENQGQN